MVYTRLSVDPDGYSHSATKATAAVRRLESAGQHALKKLAPLAHMGGDDSTGGKFAHGYDAQARSIFDALGVLCTALSQAAALFGASAVSHANAEAANSGSSAPTPTVADPPAAVTVAFDHPASAYGGTNIVPQGWTFIQELVSATWPDGDTGKMRTGKAAWNALADDIDDATSSYIATLLDPLQGFQAPDIAAIADKTSQLAPAAKELAGFCRDLAHDCGAYADAVDKAHQDAGKELEEFVITTLAAVALSVILTPITAGISDVVGGGAIAADAAITAAEVGETLGVLARVAPVLGKLGDASRAVSGLGRFGAKAIIFTGKTVTTGTVWGLGSIYGDRFVNGDDFDPVNDLKYAVVSGFFVEGGKVAGEALSATAKGVMSGTAKAASDMEETAGKDIPEALTEPTSEPGLSPHHGLGPKHLDEPKHRADPDPVAIRVTTGGIKAVTYTAGTAAGVVAGSLATTGVDPEKIPGEMLVDGIEGKLPILNPGGPHTLRVLK